MGLFICQGCACNGRTARPDVRVQHCEAISAHDSCIGWQQMGLACSVGPCPSHRESPSARCGASKILKFIMSLISFLHLSTDERQQTFKPSHDCGLWLGTIQIEIPGSGLCQADTL